MTQRIASYVIIAAGIMGIGTQIFIHQLDKATAHQCKTHDWPADKHGIHMEFCTSYGYPTN